MNNVQIYTKGAIDIATAYKNYVAFLDASPRTIQSYTCNVRQFIKWAAAHKITAPTREDIIAYRDDLRARCKPATVQAYIVALRLFFQWTAQAGIYPNVAERIKGAKIGVEHKKDYLTAEQIRFLLKNIDRKTAKGKRDYSMILLMITGGLRDIEVSRANIEDLRQINGFTALFIQGKGRQERNDYIKVVAEAERALREYLKLRGKIQPTAPLFASFSNNGRGGRLTTRAISRIVKTHLINAGYISDRLTAHSLRHTAVTLSLLGGLPLEEVQQFARHNNIATTQIYAHNLERAKNRSEDTIATSIFTGRGDIS